MLVIYIVYFIQVMFLLNVDKSMVMMEFSSYDIQGTNRTMKKMLVFTVMMVVVPIVSYFFSKSFIFEGN